MGVIVAILALASLILALVSSAGKIPLYPAVIVLSIAVLLPVVTSLHI